MAAPSHTAAPTYATLKAAGGIQLPRGFKSILVFARLPLCFFFIMKLKPGKIGVGDKIDQSTMLNDTHKTTASSALIEDGDSVVEAAYDPNLRAQIRASLLGPNTNGSVTEYWPDGSYEDYYGFLLDAEFSQLADKELPMVTLTVCKSNYDPVNKIEVPPVFTAVSGT